ncbi:esterase/lipase family protein [Streptomyces lavendofoliae]|uniref:esterase/lipase family protein n=1 Tax=Streptomyces lavendofoliae TaxID=67314 RepID=UPI00300F083C
MSVTAGVLASSLAVPPGAAAAADTPPRRPIVFVHGWHSGPGMWDSMQRYAKSAGYSARDLHTFDYSSMSTSQTSAPIEDIAEQLNQFISDRRLTELSPDHTVDIVAHSMGSLVARHYMKFQPGALEKVTHYVSLAGPNHGTILADKELAVPKLALDLIKKVSGLQFIEDCDLQCSQMARDSDFMMELNAGEETPQSDSRRGMPQYTTFRSNVGDEPILYNNTRHLVPTLGMCDEAVFGVTQQGRLALEPGSLGDTSALAGATNLTTGCLRHSDIPNDRWTQEQVLDTLAAPTVEDLQFAPQGKRVTPVRAYTRCNDLRPAYRSEGGLYNKAWVQTCLRVGSDYHQVSPEVRVRGCGHSEYLPITRERVWNYAPEANGDNIPCTVHGDYTLHHPKGNTDGTLHAALGTRDGVAYDDNGPTYGGHGGYTLTWRDSLTVNQSGKDTLTAHYDDEVAVRTACSPVLPDPRCPPRPPRPAHF